MFLVYLIGRYIGVYGVNWLDKITAKRALLYSIVMLAVTFILNNFMVFINERIHFVAEWHYLPFARDCSLTQLFLAILIFSYFRKISPFSSSIVNRVSTYCSPYMLYPLVCFLLLDFMEGKIWIISYCWFFSLSYVYLLLLLSQ